MKKSLTLVVLSILFFSLSACSKGIEYVEGEFIESVILDKSRYNPGDEVGITLNLSNDESLDELEIVIEIYQLSNLVDTLNLDCQSIIETSWESPNIDNTGYMMKVSLLDKNKLLDIETVGIDVSSDWTFNPRYGFLTDYSHLDEEETNEILDELKEYHISGLQFYDWQYKHHMPYDEDLDEWFEISNNFVEADVIENYISYAHDINMMAMNYNLIFGTYDDYLEDGVLLEWALFKDQSHMTLDYHQLPDTWATNKLYIMDPNNAFWREYIANQEGIVFSNFDFDGWHMDQLGDRGYTFTYGGTRVDLQNSYSSYIRYMKSELDTRILFNIVNNYGMIDVLQSTDLDFIYAELWDNHTYNELGNTIKLYRNISGKPVVLAAYMNYDLSDQKGEFNSASVLLTDATIFSFGATHIELGDHGMLGNEYFPNDNLRMSETLKVTLKNYYDFQVAYQNILIDSVEYIDAEFSIEDYEYSDNGSSDTIWGHSTKVSNYEVLHLINLLENENDWRDNEGDKLTPKIIKDFTVKYYIDGDVKNVYIASPDYKGGLMEKLDFKVKLDSKGQYIEIDVDFLEYWDMIIIEK